MIFSRLTGTGSYLPERVVTNAELESLVDTSDAWIRERTGIRERHIVADDESTCDLAERAARQALEAAGAVAAEIDLIVVGTTTPDRVYPSVACRLQARLGATPGRPAFDVQAVCTFGDGAGAVVLEAAEEPGVYSTHLHADGRYESLLFVEGGVPIGDGRIAEGNAYTKMRGNEVFRMAVRTLARIVDETLEANGMTAADVDWLIPHQANIRIIEATAKKLRLSLDRVVVTVGEHGNTSAASVPLALDVGVRDGRIRRDDVLLLEAFGGGFTWGSALVRY
jgi:3-oxoacyl-[acyl-carrier-protein] synthase-3